MADSSGSPERSGPLGSRENPGITDSHDRLLHAVERVAGIFTESGIPRMAARVFAYVLAEDADHYSAGELARALRVSPAAISGALRYLVDTRLLSKEREPGTRADLYRIHDDDVWGTIMAARLPLFAQWERALDDAIEEVGAGQGSRRLEETREFWSFMRAETEASLEAWRRRRGHPGPR